MRRSLVPMTAAVALAAATLAGPARSQEPEAAPPCTAPEHSQFDFWVGEWRVTDEEGANQGSNTIRKILDGCVLEEIWTGAGASRGCSLNIYSARRGLWHQTWVDSNGLLLLLDGGLEEEGLMVLRGEGRAGHGAAIDHEISWRRLPSGQVRQVWKVSRDGGERWETVFAGIYTRVER